MCSKSNEQYRVFAKTRHPILVFWKTLPSAYRNVTVAFAGRIGTMFPYLLEAEFDAYFAASPPFPGWESLRDAYVNSLAVYPTTIEIEGEDFTVYLAANPPTIAYANWTLENGSLFLDCDPPNTRPF